MPISAPISPQPSPKRVGLFAGDPDGYAASMAEADRIDSAPVAPPSLKERFGYSTSANLKDPKVIAGDQAARARVLGGSYQPMLDDPGDARRAEGRTPTRSESRNEDQYVGAQVQKFEHDAEAVESAKDADIAEVARENAGLLAQAKITEQVRARQAQDSLLQQFGTADPKMIEYIKETDRKNSLREGFSTDIAAIEKAKAAELASGSDPKEVHARYDREYRHRLARYVADINGQVPGQAFAEPKPQTAEEIAAEQAAIDARGGQTQPGAPPGR